MPTEDGGEIEAVSVDQAAMVMARAFHWADRHLDGLMADPQFVANQLAVVGCSVSSIVLRTFATELCIKALYLQENPGSAKWGHDLKELFLSLRPETQTAIESRFERIRDEKKGRGIYSGELEPLGDILEEHKGDFEKWRYIYEHIGVGLHTQPTALNSIIEAALEEFVDRSKE